MARTVVVGVSAFVAGVLVVGGGLALWPGLAPGGAPARAAAPSSTASVPSSTASTPPATTVPAVRIVIRDPDEDRDVGGLTYDVQGKVPVLRGASKRAAKTFAQLIDAALDVEAADLESWRASCPGEAGERLINVAVVRTDIYRDRWASVLLDVESDGCGGEDQTSPHGVTVDLRTGDAVGLGVFTDPGSLLDGWAVARQLDDGPCSLGAVVPAGGRAPDLPKDALVTTLPREPDAWQVSAQGITFAYAKDTLQAGACGTRTATVPWQELLPAVTPEATRGTVWLVPADAELSDDVVRSRAVGVSVRGAELAAYGVGGSGHCAAAVRGDGEVTVLPVDGVAASLRLSVDWPLDAASPEPVDGWRVLTDDQADSFGLDENAFDRCGL